MMVFHLFSDRPENVHREFKIHWISSPISANSANHNFVPHSNVQYSYFGGKKCHVTGCDQMNLSKDFASINDLSSFRRSRRTKLFHGHA